MSLILDSAAYQHVLLNHLPITGLAFATLFLGWSLFDDAWRGTVFALVCVAFCSLSTGILMETGEEAYPRIFDALDGYGRGWLDHHVWLADRLGWIGVGNGLIALVALVYGRTHAAQRRRLAMAVLATSVATLVAVAVIAEAGGKVRHPEFRTTEPPIHQSDA